jgi:hypothetical protein
MTKTELQAALEELIVQCGLGAFHTSSHGQNDSLPRKNARSLKVEIFEVSRVLSGAEFAEIY